MQDFAIIGLGQLGRLFGAGALRGGYRVTPVLRDHDPARRLASLPTSAPILVAVGESALPTVVAAIPQARRPFTIFVQNGLTRSSLAELGVGDATLANVWTNKKPNQPVLVGRPTAIYGPLSDTFVNVHEALKLPAAVCESERDIDTDLVAKYAFILTINALGYRQGGTVGELLDGHGSAVEQWLDSATRIGAARAKVEVDLPQAVRRAREAMEAMRAMPAAGRSAQRRYEQAAEDAMRLGIDLP